MHDPVLLFRQVPGNGNRPAGIVRQDGIHGLRQFQRRVQVAEDLCLLQRVRDRFDLVAFAHEAEDLQGFQRPALRVEECLVVHSAAAVVFSCVLRIIDGGMA